MAAGEVQVYPASDVIAHDTDGVSCECNPEIRYLEDGRIVVTHRAVDESASGWTLAEARRISR